MLVAALVIKRNRYTLLSRFRDKESLYANVGEKQSSSTAYFRQIYFHASAYRTKFVCRRNGKRGTFEESRPAHEANQRDKDGIRSRPDQGNPQNNGAMARSASAVGYLLHHDA